MSAGYQAVTWNPYKRRFDLVLTAGVLGTLAGFVLVTLAAHPTATLESALIRGLGLTGFLLLHLIVAIGPLARLDRRFLSLLYNRRHLGVTLALLALGHAAFVVVQYHALGNRDPLASLLASHHGWRLDELPFEYFGVAALGILIVLAATSHDYWLSVLTPPVWKRLHLLVYVAYIALVAHVAFGILQDERHPIYLIATGLGGVLIGGLHLAAGWRERRLDRPGPGTDWVDLGPVDGIREGRARIALVAGERVAVFRHQDRLSCVSNVCRHQNGPLGEGRIIDGCITCPWHGYQYRPEDGTSPPPFLDQVPTFNLRVERGRVLVDPRPNPLGTTVPPVMVSGPNPPPPSEFFVGYQPDRPPGYARFHRRATVTLLILGIGTAAALALAQRTFQPANFEYGRQTTVAGVIRLAPYPVLETAAEGRVRRYLLAGPGKRGAQAVVGPFAGQPVRLTGSLAHRDRLDLLEVAGVAPDSAAPATPVAEPPTDLGRYRLDGEIVDSKCYLGVMNPGLGRVHRGCATRCLAGGMTPLFVTPGPAGTVVEMILVDPAMAPVPAVEDLAGSRVVLEGRVWRQGDLWFFQIDGLPRRLGSAAHDPGRGPRRNPPSTGHVHGGNAGG